jgi:SAM-dependent methyltransferase
VKPEFDNYAAEYDALLRDPLRDGFGRRDFFHERKISLIRDYFRYLGADPLKCSWIDIGCGQGDLLRAGLRDFGSAVGCDVSLDMLEACKGLPVFRQVHEDRLPFPDKSADFVTAVCVYHHVPLEKRGALTRAAKRVLKPGGTFCIIEHNPVNPITQMIVKRTPIDADARLLGIKETRRLLRVEGFRIAWERYFLFLPERLYWRIDHLENYFGRLPLGGQYAIFAHVS